jgi:hypothetical protein
MSGSGACSIGEQLPTPSARIVALSLGRTADRLAAVEFLADGMDDPWG